MNLVTENYNIELKMKNIFIKQNMRMVSLNLIMLRQANIQ